MPILTDKTHTGQCDTKAAFGSCSICLDSYKVFIEMAEKEEANLSANQRSKV